MSLWSGIFTQNKNSLKSYTAICHSMINEMQNILFPVIVNANGNGKDGFKTNKPKIKNDFSSSQISKQVRIIKF